MKNKLKMGMLGGGPGAFIGDVHRKATGIDGNIEIVAGAFDIDPEKHNSASPLPMPISSLSAEKPSGRVGMSC